MIVKYLRKQLLYKHRIINTEYVLGLGNDSAPAVSGEREIS